jgi:hypothetical protein
LNKPHGNWLLAFTWSVRVGFLSSYEYPSLICI